MVVLAVIVVAVVVLGGGAAATAAAAAVVAIVVAGTAAPVTGSSSSCRSGTRRRRSRRNLASCIGSTTHLTRPPEIDPAPGSSQLRRHMSRPQGSDAFKLCLCPVRFERPINYKP